MGGIIGKRKKKSVGEGGSADELPPGKGSRDSIQAPKEDPTRKPSDGAVPPAPKSASRTPSRDPSPEVQKFEEVAFSNFMSVSQLPSCILRSALWLGPLTT